MSALTMVISYFTVSWQTGAVQTSSSFQVHNMGEPAAATCLDFHVAYPSTLCRSCAWVDWLACWQTECCSNNTL